MATAILNPSLDGTAQVTGVDDTSIATLRAENGTGNDSSTSIKDALLIQSINTTHLQSCYRTFFVFDTSILGSSSVISAATLQFYVTAVNNTFPNADSIRVTKATLASNTAIATSDFQGTVADTTAQTSDVTLASLTTSSYNTFTLNATGLSNISKTGKTVFGFRSKFDADSSAPGQNFNGQKSQVTGHFRQAANPPILTITYTPTTLNQSDTTALTDSYILGFFLSLSDTFSGITDAIRSFFGWGSQTKNSTTWTNVNKS